MTNKCCTGTALNIWLKQHLKKNNFQLFRWNSFGGPTSIIQWHLFSTFDCFGVDFILTMWKSYNR